MQAIDETDDGSRGFVRTFRENWPTLGVTAAIGLIGFVTTLLVLNDPGVDGRVPALMAVSTLIFTLIAADVVRRPVRWIVILAGLMLFGFLTAMALGPTMADMIRSARHPETIVIEIPDASGPTDGDETTVVAPDEGMPIR